MVHQEILSEKVFGELSLIGRAIYMLVSSEYSSDSDDGNTRPTERQQTLVTDSDTESENETTVLANVPLLL